MAKIGLFFADGRNDRGSYYALGTIDFKSDFNDLAETFDKVCTAFVKDIELDGEQPGAGYTLMSYKEWKQDWKTGEIDYYSYSTPDVMGNTPHSVHKSVNEAVTVLMGMVVDNINENVDETVTNTFDTAAKVKSFIEEGEVTASKKDIAEQDKWGIHVGDSMYRVFANDETFVKKVFTEYSSKRIAEKLVYTGDLSPYGYNSKLESYINAKEVADVKDMRKRLEIFPLPAGYAHKWFARLKDDHGFQVTGLKQSDVVLRAAVIEAARNRFQKMRKENA